MSFSLITATVGVLVAMSATGTLVRRWIRRRRVGIAVWTVAVAALTVALLAQSVGFAAGFSPVTFRAIQLGAGLVAPLWLAWGMLEAAAESLRFGVALVTGVLTAVSGVVLATDPLTAEPFTRTWPRPSTYYQTIPHDLLAVGQAAAGLVAVAALTSALVTAGRRRHQRLRMSVIATGFLAVLLVIATRFPLPVDSAYPACCAAAAALVWIGATRRRAVAQQPAGRLAGPVGGDGEPGGGTAGRQSGRQGREVDRPTADVGDPTDGTPLGDDGVPSGALASPARDREPAVPARYPALVSRPNPRGTRPPRPYGRIAVYTLLEDRVADFDRLAAATVDEVRSGEPGTLIYVIHTVPKAPMQRIFYEVYRDRAAFEWHERQPYIRRFVERRRPCVLATNVIELRLTHAKLSPLAPVARRADDPGVTRAAPAPSVDGSTARYAAQVHRFEEPRTPHSGRI